MTGSCTSLPWGSRSSLALGRNGCELARLPSIRARQAVTVAALGIILGGATIYYCRFWANDWVLYGRALAVAPGNNLATNNLAADLSDLGRYEEAIALYERILARAPDYSLARYNLGYCQYRTGRFEEARRTSRAPSPSALRNPSLTSIWASRIFAPATWRKRLRTSAKRSRSVRKTPVIGSVWDGLEGPGRFRSPRRICIRPALEPTLSDARQQLKEIDKQRAAP